MGILLLPRASSLPLQQGREVIALQQPLAVGLTDVLGSLFLTDMDQDFLCCGVAEVVLHISVISCAGLCF